MIIKILGPGCPGCIKLENKTKEALQKLCLEAEIIKISDMKEIVSYGVLGLPAIVINEAVVMYGQNPSIEEIIQLINNNK